MSYLIFYSHNWPTSKKVFIKTYFKNPQFAKVSHIIDCTCISPFLLILKIIETKMFEGNFLYS